MPAETLHLRYSAVVMPNRRRTRHSFLRSAGLGILWVIGLGLVIALLMKMGMIGEPRRPVFLASGFPHLQEPS